MINKKNINNIKKYFLIFLVYSIIGWCYEVFLEVFIYKWGFTNRGVLFGPYCPVYGFGALAFIICFNRFLKDKSLKQKLIMIPFIFLGCMGVATFIELITSYICEFFTGSWPWQTYADYKINFQARIALSPSIRFGLGGLVFLYILQPFLDKMFSNISIKMLNILTIIFTIILFIDLIYTFVF